MHKFIGVLRYVKDVEYRGLTLRRFADDDYGIVVDFIYNGDLKTKTRYEIIASYKYLDGIGKFLHIDSIYQYKVYKPKKPTRLINLNEAEKQEE